MAGIPEGDIVQKRHKNLPIPMKKSLCLNKLLLLFKSVFKSKQDETIYSGIISTRPLYDRKKLVTQQKRQKRQCPGTGSIALKPQRNPATDDHPRPPLVALHRC